MPIRIIIAENHPTFRAGVRALLRLFPNVNVVAEATDDESLLRATKRHKPHIVLMNLSLPRSGGVAVTRRLREQFPHVRVLLLSLRANALDVRAAIRAGASGILIHNLAEELETAIETVAKGRTYFRAAISQTTPPALQPSLIREAHQPLLTPRQQEILRLIARGYTTKEIAHKLKISVKTAETHRTQLMARLDVHNVAELVRYAIRTGYIASDQ